MQNVQIDAGGYDSSYEGDEEEIKRKKKKLNLSSKDVPKQQGTLFKNCHTFSS